MLPVGNRGGRTGIIQLKTKEKALRGHPEGFLGGLTLLAVDEVKSR